MKDVALKRRFVDEVRIVAVINSVYGVVAFTEPLLAQKVVYATQTKTATKVYAVHESMDKAFVRNILQKEISVNFLMAALYLVYRIAALVPWD